MPALQPSRTKINYQTGPIKVLTGSGKHNLGDVTGTSSVKVAGRCCRAVGVQSLEERVETIENVVHAGNISLQLAGEATLAKKKYGYEY